ncbi:MAG: rRNA pseudouridine synthase [Verrucomicrobia bacterium]|nr:MAG: rRNA pseudouridine synthase [Verrucomicrobiota bacterium]RPF86058.1 MAG: rRNA pseudouridine synthase [Roseibacillus sp. TMED18]
MLEGTRLNKFLASCGLGSRRACDALVQRGGVTLNGEACTNPATRIQEGDILRVEGKRVSPKKTTTILLKKPRGYVCSKHDELERATIYELLPPKFSHLNHVGRLDRDSEGLLVLTNDGDLANRLTHPSNRVEKEYRVTLTSSIDYPILKKLVAGVQTPEGYARAKSTKRLSPRRVSIILETGLKRQIREMFQTLGYEVEKLFRIRIGRLTDPELRPGRWRHLEHHEVELLSLDPPAEA